MLSFEFCLVLFVNKDEYVLCTRSVLAAAKRERIAEASSSRMWLPLPQFAMAAALFSYFVFYVDKEFSRDFLGWELRPSCDQYFGKRKQSIQLREDLEIRWDIP